MLYLAPVTLGLSRRYAARRYGETEFGARAIEAVCCWRFVADFPKCSFRIRSNSSMVCGSAHEPCGPGTMTSDCAPSRCELQYGTTPSLLSASGPGLPRLPIIEW